MRGGWEFEDHVIAAEAIVRQLEKGDMRLNEAIDAFRCACEHVEASERLLQNARLEVERLGAGNGDGAATEPLTLS